MNLLKNFANVKNVVINEKETQVPETMIDIYFDHMGAVLDNTSRLAETLGVSSEQVIYNHELLAMYLIRDPQDIAPSDVAGRHESVFGYHPLILAATLSLTVVTIWISAWIPARKLSRLTPLEAIKNTGELQLKRKKKSPLLTCLFGLEGGIGRQRIESAEKGLTDSVAQSGILFPCLYYYAVLFCTFRNQHKGNLF